MAKSSSENPSKNIPKAIKSVFWRILIFYIGTIFVIACVIPYTDPNLLNMDLDTIAVSPFTLIFEKAGMAYTRSPAELGSTMFQLLKDKGLV